MKNGKKKPHSGMNLNETLKIATRNGCHIIKVRKTGEVRVTHPSFPHPVVCDSRRKDSPRKLTTLVMRVVRENEDDAETPVDGTKGDGSNESGE